MWYILNYIPPPGARRSALPAVVDAFNEALAKRFPKGAVTPVELFAPTFVSLVSEGGHVRQSERPLLYHYIFVRGDEAAVKALCAECQGFSFVIDHTGSRRHLSVSDATLEQFRLIARFYSGQLPCFPLEGINLEEGDRVQIVSGPCAGLEGTYITRKGARSGNILVSVDGSMAAVVYDIKAEYVRVLEFARDSRRLYDHLDAFASKLSEFLSSRSLPELKTGCVSQADLRVLAAASSFVSRLSKVKVPNPKIAAKLFVLLYAAYSLLADAPRAASAFARYEALASNVTNPKTQEFISLILTSFPPKPI